jgi:hypothetical protein
VLLPTGLSTRERKEGWKEGRKERRKEGKKRNYSLQLKCVGKK